MNKANKNLKVLISLPAYNEEVLIRQSAELLKSFCEENLKNYAWKIVVADNGSTDKTAEIAKELETENPGKIKYQLISKKGKGRAIRESWLENDADIYAFMDADMATDLSALPDLISSIEDGFEVSAGSRFLKRSRAIRTFKRKITSLGYSWLVRMKFGLKIKDYPCGFKAVSRRAMDEILPQIKNDTWFFDTEFLIRAARKNFNIKEIPVKWQDKERDSKVNILKLIGEYMSELNRLKKDLTSTSN
ncbi:glycosyltransferase [Candidatus Parcubacteria bacterium]|nr:MAG: glycosyltransferase [Candidatus Parcubacteria bacterium]